MDFAPDPDQHEVRVASGANHRQPVARTNLNPPPSWRTNRRDLGVVVVVAIAVRLAYLFDAARLPTFDRPSADAALYLDHALRLVAAGFLDPEVFFKPPLYPYALAAIAAIAGDSFFWLRFPGLLIGTATCGLAWFLGHRLFGRRVALVAGSMLALHRTAVYFDGELLEIGLATAVQTAALVLTLHAASRSGRRGPLLAGIALGLGCVARPTFLLFAAAAVLWLGRGRRLAAALGVALALLPVTLHNAVRGPDFVLVSSNGGLNFYLGNNAQANGRNAAAAELPPNPAAAARAARTLAESAAGQALRPSQVSDYWLRRGVSYLGSHPVHALQLLGRKLFFAWTGAELGDNEDLAGIGRHLHFWRWLPIGAWLVMPLGLVGVIAARGREVGLARGFVLLQIAGILPFFVVARFRMPWVPVLAVFAAWTAVTLVERRRQGLRLGLATAAAVAFCNAPWFGVRDPVDFDFEYRLAYAYQQRGDFDAALAGFRDAARRNPRHALARNAIAVMLAERGSDLDEAVRLAEEAIALDPARAAHYYETLAGVQARRGDAVAAARAAAAGLAAQPDPATATALRARAAAARARLDSLATPTPTPVK